MSGGAGFHQDAELGVGEFGLGVFGRGRLCSGLFRFGRLCSGVVGVGLGGFCGFCGRLGGFGVFGGGRCCSGLFRFGRLCSGLCGLCGGGGELVVGVVEGVGGGFAVDVGVGEFFEGVAVFALGLGDGALVEAVEADDFAVAGFGGAGFLAALGVGQGVALERVEGVLGVEVVEAVAELEGVFELEVVVDVGGDLAAVGFEELEVFGDGGVGDVELVRDLAEGAALLAELVGLADAGASLGGGGHWCSLSLWCSRWMGDGITVGVGWGFWVVAGVGAGGVEIPAASAGMTELGRGCGGKRSGGGEWRGGWRYGSPGGAAYGGLGVVWGAGAVKGVGFGPQIKSGATDLGAGVGGCTGQIPARGRE